MSASTDKSHFTVKGGHTLNAKYTAWVMQRVAMVQISLLKQESSGRTAPSKDAASVCKQREQRSEYLQCTARRSPARL